ncbi:hypothetical protein HETIRDRAFT_421304 [Heterobasidion irregulare TC 32-1]|uniref:Protein kinase domain-containing protein n=1 Tax=Heterobasidion irregulare (strain TC 32-1) TaxID=747525 RepID=W4JUJ8_HETIT|nr:uncharacterized protein HETIRDRAFT_421304 [Heterobasidion irregulare TC 32-1]ETW77144.1 hypothetical protein HETIRDRAFT_421304 [Heterobasidion irregulare TC 32-1]
MDQVVNEQRVMRAVDASGREGFLPLRASRHDSQNFYLVTPYCFKGDLARVIQFWGSGKIPHSLSRYYAAKLLKLLEGLHGFGIIHRDLNPANILFDAEGCPLIGDFGLARMFHVSYDLDGEVLLPMTGLFDRKADKPAKHTYLNCGTTAYMSPEALKRHLYSYESDLWSYSCILYEMLTGRAAFASADATLSEEAAFKPCDSVDPLTQIFVHLVLNKERADRPKLSAMKSHPYFISIDWERISKNEIKPSWVPLTRNPFMRSYIYLSIGPPTSPSQDPSPDFAFTSPNLFDITLPLTKETESSTPPCDPTAVECSVLRGFFSKAFG